MFILTGAVAAATIALPHPRPHTNRSVPSMANGLPGEAMRGHRWVTAAADFALQQTFEELGVTNVWTSGQFEAVVPPELWSKAEQALKGREWSTRHHDFQDMLENDKEARRKTPYVRGMRNDTFYAAWRTYEEIEDYVDFLRTLAPADMLIEDIVAGTTYENREIRGIKVLGGADPIDPGFGVRPSFVMHGCHHSGEWITAMGMVYFIEQIITTYGTDPALTRIADEFEFDLIPIMNVDGYLFAWENDQFRTWRKSRSIHPANIEAWAECEESTPGNCEGCFGTDLNRNWDINWCGTGASENPCSGSYCGIFPFEEPEARTMAEFVRNLESTIYIDHHCCGDMYLQPYGWTEELPPDHDEMDPVWAAAKAATDLLYGRNYRQGPTYTTIYPASGLGLDYMYVGADVPFSIATEMRSSNGNGPADPVLPGSQEVWEGIKAAGLYVLNNYEPPGRGEHPRCVLCAAHLRLCWHAVLDVVLCCVSRFCFACSC